MPHTTPEIKAYGRNSIIMRRGMTAKRAERAARVLALREAGAKFTEIAKLLDISTSTAHEDFTRAIRETFREPAETMIHLEAQRLDRLQAAHWKKATAKADVKSATVVLKIMERRARLFGLDTIKHEVSGEVLEALGAAFRTLDETPLDEFLDVEDEDPTAYGG